MTSSHSTPVTGTGTTGATTPLDRLSARAFILFGELKILFTVEEAAQILEVAPTWLYERTRKKAIPFRKLGKYVRFTMADLEAIIEAMAVGGL